MFNNWLNQILSYPITKPSDEVAYIPPSDVKEISKALTPLKDDDLRSKFKPDTIIKKKIYKYEGFILTKDDIEEALDNIHELREFYQDAAKKGNAVMHYFN